MKSPLIRKILIITEGHWDHASSRTRVLEYIPLLRKEGYQIHWIPRIPQRSKNIIQRISFAIRKRYQYFLQTIFIACRSWDVVICQRQCLSSWKLQLLRKKHIPIIYDFDDAIYLKNRGKRYNPQKWKLMVKTANRVIVSNTKLQQKVHELGRKAEIIPTQVNVNRFQIKSNYLHPPPFRIGWTGSPTTAPYLLSLQPILSELAQKYSIEFICIGIPIPFRSTLFKVISIPWSYETEPHYLSSLDVGVMPLPDDEWTQAKAGYKLLLYMAAGLPVVASPVGVNSNIVVKNETGFLAKDDSEWLKFLKLLLENPNLRQQMGKAGRQRVLELYDINVTFNMWKNILKKI